MTFETAITGAGFSEAPEGTGDPFGLSSLTGSFGAGAGFAEPMSPPSDVSWEMLSKNPYYAELGDLGIPNLDQINFSDAFIDFDKFGINYNTPFVYPGQVQLPSDAILPTEGGAPLRRVQKTNQFGETVTEFEPIALDPWQQFGDIRLMQDGQIQRLQDGQWGTVDQWGQYDRDPSDIMGWIDPRHKLIFEDAPGWNDPLSNWLQSKGENYAADMLGRLSFGARRGDSSSAGYTPETWWVQNMSPEEASAVMRISPEDYSNVKNWANEYFSPGAQSARHDAMFGSDWGDILGLAGTALSFIPGLQPIGIGLGALNAIQNENPLGLLSAGLGLANLGPVMDMAISDFADFGFDGLSALSDSLNYAAPSWSIPSFDIDSPLASLSKIAKSPTVSVGTKLGKIGLGNLAQEEMLGALASQLEERELQDSPEMQTQSIYKGPRWAGYSNF